MYKILVPVDFSKKSDSAVKMSAQIGKKIKSEIQLLYKSGDGFRENNDFRLKCV